MMRRIGTGRRGRRSCVWVATTAAALLAACTGDEFAATPEVQPSVTAEARWAIDINRIVNGKFRTYRPRCMDDARVGQTVEFRNFSPDIAANVTSIAGPVTLFSPSLRRPYNLVTADDPTNPICEVVGDDGTCQQRPEFSYWRFTFNVSGVYDWIDTNSGQPGRQVVDAYYGTVTFVGIDLDTPFGTVCVAQEDGSGCDGVCCQTDVDCDGTNRCIRTEVGENGRCLTP